MHRRSPAASVTSAPRRLALAIQGAAIFLLTAGCGAGLPGVPAPSPAEIPSLESRAAERPSDSEARIRLGAAYLEAGRGADALRVLRQALALEPADRTTRVLLALAHEREESWEEALTFYDDVLAEEVEEPLRSRLERQRAGVRRASLQAQVRTSLAREAELADTEPTPGTLAIFPFEFGSGDEQYRPLGAAFTGVLTSSLARIERITVLERQRVQFLLDEMAMSESGRTDPATAVRSGRLLGAARVVQGRLDVAGASSLEVLTTVVGVGAGATVPAPFTESDALPRFYELQERVLLALVGSLGLELSPLERERLLDRPTESLEALLAWGRALEAEDAGDFQGALDAYREAVQLDPGFAEAGEGLDQAEDLVAVSATPPPGPGTTTGLPGLPGPLRDPGVEWGIDARGGTGIPQIASTPVNRDPAPELLDRDRTGNVTAILEILIRRPGG